MSRRYTLTVLAVAVLFGWLWLAAAQDDRRLRFQEVPEGGPVTILATEFQLESLQRVDQVNDRWGEVRLPLPKAVLVRATVGYDATGADVPSGLLCTVVLSGPAGIWWYPESVTPADPAKETFCEAGRVGALEASFEIPAAMVDQVRGVNLSVYDGVPGGPLEPDRLLLSPVG
ncbi:MAG: hypothetical protein QM804_18660 [Propionicimonas sp.]